MLAGERRKLHPISSTYSGTHFPFGAGCGKYDPQQSKIPSRSFPNSPQVEATSRNPPPNRDTLSGTTTAEALSAFQIQSDHIRIVCPPSNGTHPFRFSAPARSQAAVHPRSPEHHVAAGTLQGKALKTFRRTHETPAARSAQRGFHACPRTFSELYPVGSRGDMSATQPSEPGRR